MEYVICLIILIFTIIVLKVIFKINGYNIREIRKLEKNEELSEITDRFPANIEVAKDYLEMLDNKDVKIEETQDTKTSLYIAITNKIIIGDLKNNYARLQVIAHECIHSVQDKALLFFNFIISNIVIIYCLISIPLIIVEVFENVMFQLFIFTFISSIQFGIRSYLEVEAMIKSKFLVKKYMESKQLITEEEQDKLLVEYEKINKIGIPFVVGNLLISNVFRILIYVLIGILI